MPIVPAAAPPAVHAPVDAGSQRIDHDPRESGSLARRTSVHRARFNPAWSAPSVIDVEQSTPTSSVALELPPNTVACRFTTPALSRPRRSRHCAMRRTQGFPRVRRSPQNEVLKTWVTSSLLADISTWWQLCLRIEPSHPTAADSHFDVQAKRHPRGIKLKRHPREKAEVVSAGHRGYPDGYPDRGWVQQSTADPPQRSACSVKPPSRSGRSAEIFH